MITKTLCNLTINIILSGCSFQDCVWPSHPANGKHTPYEDDCPAGSKNPACLGVPGTRVPDGWFLFTTCNEGFVLDIDTEEHGHSQSTCADSKWLPSPPSCVCELQIMLML